MRTGTILEIRHDSRDLSGRPFLSSSVVPPESWQRPSPANQGLAFEEMGGASVVGAPASADADPQPNSSLTASCAGQDVNKSNFMNESVTTAARSKVTPTIKLSSFDGLTLLESHLAKFENCSEYYAWTAKELSLIHI